MSQEYPHLVKAVIWEPIEPMDRGGQYEDPLGEHLKTSGSGKLVGAGTALAANGEIGRAEIHFELANLGEALASAKALLEAQGAPVGSFLGYERDGQSVEEPLGTVQGLFAYLVLNESAAENEEKNEEDSGGTDFVDQIKEALDRTGAGEMRRAKPLGEELAIYFYGPSAEALQAVVQPILEASPMVKQSRFGGGSPPRSSSGELFRPCGEWWPSRTWAIVSAAVKRASRSSPQAVFGQKTRYLLEFSRGHPPKKSKSGPSSESWVKSKMSKFPIRSQPAEKTTSEQIISSSGELK